jgi:adenosine deaminase
VCELCPTSNHVLLPSSFNVQHPNNDRTLRSYISQGLPVVLATDDEGIWTIPVGESLRRQYTSVAAEYYHAIVRGDITTEGQLEDMMRWHRDSAFFDF